MNSGAFFRAAFLTGLTLSCSLLIPDFVTAPYAAENTDQFKILNSPSVSATAFAATIENWPTDEAIWPQLKSAAARERFLRFILETDKTDERPYQSFSNLCTGFASQMFVKYSTENHLNADEMTDLKQIAKVDTTGVAPKLKLPIYMATYFGHFFNALLIDETKPEEMSSYLIFEPQTDQIHLPGSVGYHEYAEALPIDIVSLTSYTDQGVFNTQSFHRFFKTGSGKMSEVKDPTIFHLLNYFSISETGTQNMEYYLKGRTFKQFINESMEQWKVTPAQRESAEQLILGKKLVIDTHGTSVAVTPEWLSELRKPE